MSRAHWGTVVAILAAAAASSPASGEVVEASETGFTSKSTVTVAAGPDKAFAEFLAIGKWWDSQHTYSGDAKNLSIEAKAQGCFCERLAGGGGVRHMTVAYLTPGKRLVLEGGLGPLQVLGVAGSMTVSFAPAEKGTAVTLLYSVGGHNPGGFQELAAGVDSVLHAQLERYRSEVDSGKP